MIHCPMKPRTGREAGQTPFGADLGAGPPRKRLRVPTAQSRWPLEVVMLLVSAAVAGAGSWMVRTGAAALLFAVLVVVGCNSEPPSYPTRGKIHLLFCVISLPEMY
jgi:hypothetical protein